MQFLHIVASHANTLRASSRVGEEGCDKALRTLYKREAIHHTVLPLGSIQLMFRKMPEPAPTPPPPPPPPPLQTREIAKIEPILPKFLRVLNGKIV